jgi:hypothetical protein
LEEHFRRLPFFLKISLNPGNLSINSGSKRAEKTCEEGCEDEAGYKSEAYMTTLFILVYSGDASTYSSVATALVGRVRGWILVLFDSIYFWISILISFKIIIIYQTAFLAAIEVDITSMAAIQGHGSLSNHLLFFIIDLGKGDLRSIDHRYGVSITSCSFHLDQMDLMNNL